MLSAEIHFRSKKTNTNMGWGYALGAGLSMIDSALQYGRQKALDRDERKFQHDEAELAHKRQLDFWEQQNEYNLPSNHRKRLEDAGYNILDLMRNGSAVQQAGALSSVTPAGGGRGSSAPISTLASGAVALENVRSQTSLNKANADLLNQKQRTEFLNTAVRRLEWLDSQNTREAKLEADYWRRSIQEALRGQKVQNDYTVQRTETEKTNQVVNDALAKWHNQQIDESKSRVALNKASENELVEKAKQYASLIGLQKEQTDYYVQLARKISAEADKERYIADQLTQNGLNVEGSGLWSSLERLGNGAVNFVKGMFDPNGFLMWLISSLATS